MTASNPFLRFEPDAVVIVTGAASGIGRAISREAAANGLAVAVWDLDAEGAAALAEELRGLGARAEGIVVDVTDAASVAAAFAMTREQLGACRHLVNNAGPHMYAEVTFADGLIQGAASMQAVTTRWLADAGSQAGSVVNVASTAGAVTGGTGVDWYAAAKAAVAGYTRHLALHRPNGIRANAVAPGFTRTPRTSAMLDSEVGAERMRTNPMGRAATPEEVARPVLFLLSPAAGYVNGVVLPVDGAATIVM